MFKTRGRFYILSAVLVPLLIGTAHVGAALPVEKGILKSRETLTDLAKESFCRDVEGVYKKQKWGKLPLCREIPWQVFGWSVEGRPLLYFEKGDPKSANTTLLQCTIHGDELPSLAMCLNFIREVLDEKNKLPVNSRLIVQPLLNPDGMFRPRAQRPNSRGVDINRNFPTRRWSEEALASWKKRDRGDIRKFPGLEPASEPETQAIVDFISKSGTKKIISIHTPLGFLDLDSAVQDPIARRARYLAINMSKNSGNYKFMRFGFYPGSLGNWAGREKQIPVYTLELPSGVSAPTVDAYWAKFRIALWRAVRFDLDTGQFFED